LEKSAGGTRWVAGGTVTVYLMAVLMGGNLTDAPLHYVVTVPGKYGLRGAAIAEFIIAFIMMAMVLFTSDNPRLKNHTRIFAGCLVCLNVTFVGPISGFGMNPARSFASAFPAHIYTAFWIYIFMPLAGMLGATEVYAFMRRPKRTVES
jgi:aquaporin Z